MFFRLVNDYDSAKINPCWLYSHDVPVVPVVVVVVVVVVPVVPVVPVVVVVVVVVVFKIPGTVSKCDFNVF